MAFQTKESPSPRGVGFCGQFGKQRADVGKDGGNDVGGDSRIKSGVIDSETMRVRSSGWFCVHRNGSEPEREPCRVVAKWSVHGVGVQNGNRDVTRHRLEIGERPFHDTAVTTVMIRYLIRTNGLPRDPETLEFDHSDNLRRIWGLAGIHGFVCCRTTFDMLIVKSF